MAREKRLFNALEKIVVYSQTFAAYPYNELFQTESRYNICVVYQLILLITKDFIAFSETNFQYNSEDENIIFSIFVSCTRIVISALPSINFATVMIKRQMMKDVFESFIEVDSRLETLGYHPKYIVERSITCVTSFLTIMSVICFALAVNMDLVSWLDVFHFAVALFTTSATVQLMADLISLAGQQFRLINAYLSKSSCNQSRIEFFIELHNKVSLICSVLNKLFTNQMLVISFAVFFHTTITIHLLVEQQVSFYLLYTNKIILMRVCMACVHLILGYVLINTCVWTGIQAKDFTQMLHMMVMEDDTNKLCHNKKLNLHVAMRKDVVFTACGLFNLDFTLIHSMVAAAATYLVILIQLSQQID